MPDFSSLIPDAHVRVSRGFADALIQTQREELLTGLARLHYPSGENLIFTFVEGVQQKLYRFLEENMEVIPRQSWSHALDRPDASIAFLALPVEGVRLLRVAYEAPVRQVEELTCRGDELARCLDTWLLDDFPNILHVQAEAIHRIYLVSSHPTPIIEELSLAGNKAHFLARDPSFVNSLPPADYQVTRYCSDNGHEVWQEYQLRSAFHALMAGILNRFSDLGGRVLTERLCEQLSLWLRDGGWNISVAINGVTNHHFFDSLQDAKDAYAEVVRRFNYEASPAIGLRMADAITREIMLSMDVQHQQLLQRHIYEPYMADTMAARTQR